MRISSGSTETSSPRLVDLVVRGRAHQLVDEPGPHHVGVAADRFHGGDEEGAPRATARDEEQAALVGQQRGGAGEPRRAVATVVGPGDRVDQRLDPEQGAAGPQARPKALLHACDRHDVPLAAGRRVRTDDGHRLCLRDEAGADGTRDLLLGEVVDESGELGARQPVDVVGGGVEQRHDAVEVAIRLRADGSTAFGCRGPLAFEAGGLPRLPQHVLDPAAAARGLPCLAQHGLRLLQRRRLDVGEAVHEPFGVLALVVDEQQPQQFGRVTVAPGGEFDPAQAPAQAAQRDRFGSADGTGQQGERLLTTERQPGQRPQHEQQPGDPVLAGQRKLGCNCGHRHPGRQQGPPQRSERTRHRPHHDGHAGPRHPVDEVGAAQRVCDERGLLRRRRQHPDPHGSRIVRGDGGCAAVRRETGEPPGDPADEFCHLRGGAMVGSEHHAAARVVVGERGEKGRVGTAEGEDRLVRVTGDGGGAGAEADDAHQLRGLRIEMLRVVDEQVPDPGAFPREQVRIGDECGEGGTDEFGGVEGGRGGLGGLHAHGTAQQHDLLVPGGELADGDPFRSRSLLPELDQVLRA